MAIKSGERRAESGERPSVLHFSISLPNVPFAVAVPRWVAAVRQTHPLVLLRVLFGVLMFISTVRFVAKGWVESLIITPRFHFHYWGFQWVQPLPQAWMMYAVYVVMGLCALGIALGVWYRWSMTGFLLTFAYTELIDKSYYLNHYYFIILLGIVLLLLPLGRSVSIDAWRARKSYKKRDAENISAVPRSSLLAPPFPSWMLWIVRFQIGIVWFFAGVAKLNPDWLFRAQPLSMWLTGKATYPLIGRILDQPVTAYLMSWGGAAYDLSIVFLLLYPRTRRLGFLAVLVFHGLTAILFPTIGMFPYVMLAISVAFLPIPSEIAKPLNRAAFVAVIRNTQYAICNALVVRNLQPRSSRLLPLFLITFFALQIFLPLRHWLYPGDVLWTEEGFRFSWRVMLVEKGGDVTFTLHNPATGAEWEVYPADYLTPQQEKQMAFQPDMILEFAHFLADEAAQQGHPNVEVRTKAWVAFNGRPSRLLIDPTVDLAKQPWDLGHKAWILEY